MANPRHPDDKFDGHCMRCKKKTYVTTMSFFNEDVICIDCAEVEHEHPKYKEAHDAEEAACRRGDYNFPGVGLPPDLGGKA